MSTLSVSVKHEGFKTCEQSGFCTRNRAYADNVAALGNSWTSPYSLSSKTLKIDNGCITASLLKFLGEGVQSVELPVKITFLQSGAVRITVDEKKRRHGEIELRHGSQARKERYDEASKWAIVGGEKPDRSAQADASQKETVVNYGPNNRYRVVISHSPFSINFFRDDQLHVKLNGKGLMNMEQWRSKVEKPEVKEGDEPKEGEPPAEGSEDESTWWEETFGGNTDSKPKGPESVGLDITFPGYEHVYGIPGHASSLSLKQTRYAQYEPLNPYIN